MDMWVPKLDFDHRYPNQNHELMAWDHIRKKPWTRDEFTNKVMKQRPLKYVNDQGLKVERFFDSSEKKERVKVDWEE